MARKTVPFLHIYQTGLRFRGTVMRGDLINKLPFLYSLDKFYRVGFQN